MKTFKGIVIVSILDYILIVGILSLIRWAFEMDFNIWSVSVIFTIISVIYHRVVYNKRQREKFIKGY